MINSAKARLSFVVVELEGEVEREVTTYTKGKGLEKVMVKEPAGYLVYFPKGHVLRMHKDQLKQFGLDQKPSFSDMSDMLDPNSPMGQLFFNQSENERAVAFEQLEDQVIALATVKSGKILMPEMIKQAEDVSTDIVRRKARKSAAYRTRKMALQKEVA